MIRPFATLAVVGVLAVVPAGAAEDGTGGGSTGLSTLVEGDLPFPAANETRSRSTPTFDAAAEPDRSLRYSLPHNPPRLESGASGREVLVLQERLAALRYDVGPLDGSFGSDTHHAVVAFQKVHGIERNGIVGDKVWSALAHPVVSRPQNVRDGSYLEVDLTRQVVYLVVDGRIDRILDTSTGGGYSFVVNGERRFAGTTLGAHEIFRQIPGWSNTSLGPVYDMTYFVNRTAIHGYPTVPPYPASHGCVRLTLEAMDRLWPELYLGMPVFVYRS
jgi:peptidoglycan hydrolase-like protein with peptidoglycan-binding domain